MENRRGEEALSGKYRSLSPAGARVGIPEREDRAVFGLGQLSFLFVLEDWGE
jgi:hypothetical protein